MNIKNIIVFLCIVMSIGADCAIEQKPLVIISLSYNNAELYKWQLDSVFNQRYENWHLVYLDDCSPDGTADLVKAYVQERGYADKVTIICNKRRCGAMENYYFAINHFCKPTDIVVHLDGDDRFPHEQVLAYVNEVYADGKTWLTYGQFKEYPSGNIGFCIPMPEHVVAANAFRDFSYIPSHLRTFYAGLFHKIKLTDLIHEGVFFRMTCDLATMFPMLEMARDHFKFIPHVLYEYNACNPISEHRVSKELQRKCDLAIRALPRYDKIENPF